MASIISGIIIWFLVAYIELACFGTWIIHCMIDDEAYEAPITLALKAVAFVTTPFNLWVYFYLLKKRIAKKKEKNETLIKKIGEFVDNMPRETKELFNSHITKDLKAYLIRGFTAFGENNHSGVLVYVNVAENVILDHILNQYIGKIKASETKGEVLENTKQFLALKNEVNTVFNEYRKMLGEYYYNDK